MKTALLVVLVTAIYNRNGRIVSCETALCFKKDVAAAIFICSANVPLRQYGLPLITGKTPVGMDDFIFYDPSNLLPMFPSGSAKRF